MKTILFAIAFALPMIGLSQCATTTNVNPTAIAMTTDLQTCYQVPATMVYESCFEVVTPWQYTNIVLYAGNGQLGYVIFMDSSCTMINRFGMTTFLQDSTVLNFTSDTRYIILSSTQPDTLTATLRQANGGSANPVICALPTSLDIPTDQDETWIDFYGKDHKQPLVSGMYFGKSSKRKIFVK